MPVISDTSPISNLAAIGRLDILFGIYPEVWIAPAVAEELEKHPNATALASTREALESGRLRLQSLSADGDSVASILEGELDRGEAESIALAATVPKAILIIDERKGRLIARQKGLEFTGLLGILLIAKRKNDIPSVREVIETLRADTSFFIAKSLERIILDAAGESDGD